SHTGAQIVLKRNPNYTGPRPHRLREIVYTGQFGLQRSIARVVAGLADYVPIAGSANGVRLDRLNVRYGLQSPGTQRGHQQRFVNPGLETDSLVLNVSRPLFASARLRSAVRPASDTRALHRSTGA